MYGRSEDIEVDEIALVYGQDRTSDWAVAVSRDASKGAKLDFEVFGAGKAGVWGEWKHSCTASQRGPHRGECAGAHHVCCDNLRYANANRAAASQYQSPVRSASRSDASTPKDPNGMDFQMDASLNDNSISFGIKSGGGQNGDAGGGGNGAAGPSVPDWQWASQNR